MQHVTLTDDYIERVEPIIYEEAEEMGDLWQSIENGGGNAAGLLGEHLFVDVFGGERDPTLQYDVKYNDLLVDVKTKRRSVEPEDYYECSISDHNTEQDCDVYYFVSVLEDWSEAWLLGYLPTDDYYEKSTFHEKGDVDPDNGFVFKGDCHNVAISELDALDQRSELPETVVLEE